MTNSNDGFATLLGKVFDASTADNLKVSADAEQESCCCKKSLEALAEKLKPDVIQEKLEKCCGK